MFDAKPCIYRMIYTLAHTRTHTPTHKPCNLDLIKRREKKDSIDLIGAFLTVAPSSIFPSHPLEQVRIIFYIRDKL